MRFEALLVVLVTACAAAPVPPPTAPKEAKAVAVRRPTKPRPNHFGLTGPQIRPVIAEMDGKISGCYAMEYGGQHNEGGRLVVEWSVEPNGALENAHIDQSTFQNAAFERCVLDAAKSLHFPKANGPTAIRKPYALSRRSEAPDKRR